MITSPLVDILSFHHWTDASELQARLEDYRRQSDLPLMLQEVGYHSWVEAPYGARDEAGQADLLGRVTDIAEDQSIAGWVVWTAFDFAPEPGQTATYEHFFGLWRVDLSPKPALEVLPLK